MFNQPVTSVILIRDKKVYTELESIEMIDIAFSVDFKYRILMLKFFIINKNLF